MAFSQNHMHPSRTLMLLDGTIARPGGSVMAIKDACGSVIEAGNRYKVISLPMNGNGMSVGLKGSGGVFVILDSDEVCLGLIEDFS